MLEKTYSSKKIVIACGSHIVSGYADDSFVTISPTGDGVSYTQGCDGEGIRSVSPNNSYTVKLDLLQYSKTNSFFQNKFNQDQNDGIGTFPLVVKDLSGGLLFSAEDAWVTNPAEREYGAAANTRSWELQTGPGKMSE